MKRETTEADTYIIRDGEGCFGRRESTGLWVLTWKAWVHHRLQSTGMSALLAALTPANARCKEKTSTLCE